MAKRPRPPRSLDRFLEAIPRILHSEAFETSLRDAIELLRSGAGADAAVVFLADGDAPLSEHWAPEDPNVKSRFRPRLKVEALEVIRQGGEHLRFSDGEPRDGVATRTVLLSSD